MLFLRIFALVTTTWAHHGIARYHNKIGVFHDYTGFVGRLTKKVEEKIGQTKIDIAPFISQVLDWTQKKPDTFRKEKSLILNFG